MHLVKYCTLWYMYWGEGRGFVARLSWRLVFFFFKMDGRVDG